MSESKLNWPAIASLVGEELKRHWWLMLVTAVLLAGLNTWLDHADSSGRSTMMAGLLTTAAQLTVTVSALKRWGIVTGRPRFLPFIGQSIVSTIAVGLASLLLLVPGIWLYARWFIAAPVFVAEEAGAIESLGFSFDRTRESVWPIVGLSVMIFLVAYAPLFVFSFRYPDVDVLPPLTLFITYLAMFGGLATGWLAAVALYRGLATAPALEEIFA